MVTRRYIFIFFFLSCLASCSSHPSSHWITQNELQPFPNANIEQVELVDGQVIPFDRELGWYDAEKRIIEGPVRGWHDTIPIARVRSVEIQDVPSSGSSILMALLLICAAFTVGAVVAIIDFIPRGGCMMAFISIGMMVVAIIILF